MRLYTSELVKKYKARTVVDHVSIDVNQGEIVGLLEQFKAQPQALQIPEIPNNSFAKKLYSTYLSYIDIGVIPKYAGCDVGKSWFEQRGQWQDKTYSPNPGDIIFFDWDSPNGLSGPQDGLPDHTGIVEKVENGIVYTIEGNRSDSCKKCQYPVGYYEILG